MIKTVFFDAAGTLFYLTKSVGFHYALVAGRMGLSLDADRLDRAFSRAWKAMPPRPATDAAREDDDKGWWRTLVDQVIDEVAPATRDLDRDTFFEAAYSHFAEAGVWELFEDALPVLETLSDQFQLAIISNFDGRLRMVLEHLGISKFFRCVCLSSELGADKPDPLIYRRALALCETLPGEALHVGDDPERDWQGARDAGLHVFELSRPQNSLTDVLRAAPAHG